MANPFLAVILVAIAPMAVFGLFASGLVLNKIGWAPTPLWSDQFGTPGLNIHNGVTAVSADKNGFYLAGYVGLPPDNLENPSPSAVFVARLDSSGNEIWRQNIGSAYSDRSDLISGLSSRSDGIYVVGALNGTGFVRKYDTNGSTVWTSLLASDEVGSSAAVTVGSNSVFVTVLERFTNQSSVIVLRNYSFSGDLLWKIDWGHGYLDNPSLSSGDGGIYVSGCNSTVTSPQPRLVIKSIFFVSRFEDNATLRWSNQLSSIPCLSQTILADTGGVYFFGSGNGSFDAFLDRYDLNGNLAWSQPVDASGNILEQLAMSKNSSGLFLSWGASYGTLARYDQNGHKVWSITVKTGPNRATTRMVLSALDDSVYVAGALLANSLFPSPDELASIEQFTPSSSLVIFGIYSPYSFALVGSLAGVGSLITLILFRYARRLRNERIRESLPKIFD